MQVCPACIFQCSPILLQYSFRNFTENRTSDVKQSPQDYIVQHPPKLAVTIYVLHPSSKVVHEEIPLDLRHFFFLKIQPNIKGCYLHYVWFPFSILYAWQDFWVQIKTKGTFQQLGSDKKPENEYKCDVLHASERYKVVSA